MQTTLLTTRIDNKILWMLKEYTKITKITQRKFIEDAIRHFTLEQKRQKIKESFKDVSQDKENQYLANNWVEDLLSYY